MYKGSFDVLYSISLCWLTRELTRQSYYQSFEHNNCFIVKYSFKRCFICVENKLYLYLLTQKFQHVNIYEIEQEFSLNIRAIFIQRSIRKQKEEIDC